MPVERYREGEGHYILVVSDSTIVLLSALLSPLVPDHRARQLLEKRRSAHDDDVIHGSTAHEVW